MGIPIIKHESSSFPSPNNLSTDTPPGGSWATVLAGSQDEPLLRAVLTLSPSDFKRFLELLFSRMAITAKEAVTELLWASLSSTERDLFDMPVTGTPLFSEEEILRGLGTSLPVGGGSSSSATAGTGAASNASGLWPALSTRISGWGISSGDWDWAFDNNPVGSTLSQSTSPISPSGNASATSTSPPSTSPTTTSPPGPAHRQANSRGIGIAIYRSANLLSPPSSNSIAANNIRRNQALSPGTTTRSSTRLVTSTASRPRFHAAATAAALASAGSASTTSSTSPPSGPRSAPSLSSYSTTATGGTSPTTHNT
ncbi:hypothetical protein HK102_000061, partial [Quaeritorhiza haematococci]